MAVLPWPEAGTYPYASCSDSAVYRPGRPFCGSTGCQPFAGMQNLPEAVGTMLEGKLLQSLYVRLVVLQDAMVELSSGYGHQSAGPALRDTMFPYQLPGQLPLCGRVQPLFANRSLRIWFSIARSAYIFLSRPISSSRSFNFLTSDASISPYLLRQA